MEPIFTLRQLYQSIGQFVITFVSTLLVYKGFSELTWDNVYQPLLQSFLVMLTVLGFSRTGPKPNGG